MDKRNAFLDKPINESIEDLSYSVDSEYSKEEIGDDGNCTDFFSDECGNEEDDINYEECFSEFCNSFKVIIKNPILEATAEKIKFTLLRRLKDSILITGMESSGRRTALDYAVELLKDESKIPNQLKGITFVQVNFPKAFDTSEEITDFMVKGLSKFYEAGKTKLVLFIGNLNDVPVVFQSDYFFVKSEIEKIGFDFLKFVSIFDSTEDFEECGDEFQKEEMSDFEILSDSFFVSHDLELDYLQIVKNLRPQIDELEVSHNVIASNDILEMVLLMKGSKEECTVISYYSAINAF